MSRWLSVVRQWGEVEAKFASEYGLSLRDMFDLSWRRFCVLFGGVFSWKEDAPDEPQRLADLVDWDSLRGQHKSVSQLTSGSLLQQGSYNRLGVPQRG